MKFYLKKSELSRNGVRKSSLHDGVIKSLLLDKNLMVVKT